MKYEIKPSDEVVMFEGVRYAVKTAWENVKGAKTFEAKAVAEGAEDNGKEWFPAERIEAFRLEDGTWDVSGNFGEDARDEDEAAVGIWGWKDGCGVRYVELEMPTVGWTRESDGLPDFDE